MNEFEHGGSGELNNLEAPKQDLEEARADLKQAVQDRQMMEKLISQVEAEQI